MSEFGYTKTLSYTMENVNPLYARINELEKRLNFYLRIPDREAMLDHHFDYLEDKGWKLTLKGGFPIWKRRGKVYKTKKEENWYTNDGLDFEVEEDGSISKTRNENTDEDSEEEDSEDEDTDDDEDDDEDEDTDMTSEELQIDFWDNMCEMWGYDIIGSESHPLKKAFKLYCEMKKEKADEDK